MDIREIKAGRELDALIHFKVLKKTSAFLHDCNYSTDISAAWEVVEKIQKDAAISVTGYMGKYLVIIAYDEEFERSYIVEKETAPLAICLAALLALEGD